MFFVLSVNHRRFLKLKELKGDIYFLKFESSFIKSNERSEDPYIGLADFFFFSGKSLKFVHAQF